MLMLDLYLGSKFQFQKVSDRLTPLTPMPVNSISIDITSVSVESINDKRAFLKLMATPF